MKAKLATPLAVVTTMLAMSAPLSAHHSTAVFEITTPIWVKGTVVKFNWGSPHTAIIVEQVAEDGGKIRWALENSGRLDMLLLLEPMRTERFFPSEGLTRVTLYLD